MQKKDIKSSGEEGNTQSGTNNGHEMLADINTDENMAGTTHLNANVVDESEVEKLQEQLQDQKEKYLRLLAEFDNSRKRSKQEIGDLIRTAGKDVVVSLLDVLDDCDRAEQQIQTSKNIDEIKSGVQLVFNKLRAALRNKGLKPMDSIGQDFDVEKHEAIAEIPAPSEDLKGKVIDEVTKGYYLNDKIIRFAKVIVGK